MRKHSPSLPCTNGHTSEDTAGRLNDHFAAICQSLPEFDPSQLPAYLPSPQPPRVQEYQVAKKLSEFKLKRSTTPIDLPITLYKEFAVELAIPLCSIINASISQFKVPTDWKTAYVTPTPKVNNPQSFDQLRPIAITPLPSLLCESFVFDWASASIKKFIDNQQFGNIKSSSTTHCLISLLDFVYKNLEQWKTSVILTFLDFKKAFDLVDHNVIIIKALGIGMEPGLVAWLADFLSDRQQVVRYQGAVSLPQTLKCGVPQGTRMGPLCFLILINDALTDTHRWKYVDDSTVGVVVDNTAPDYHLLQQQLDNLQAWTEANNVSINHNKTVVMHLHTSNTPVPPPTVTLAGHPLQVVETTKILGIMLDSKMDWKNHITTTTQSASYRLYMLRRLKSLGTPQCELRSIYHMFILSKLTYASPSWFPSINTTQKKQLERVQKRACRIILGADYTTYSEDLITLGMVSLDTVHHNILRRFSIELLSNPRHRDMLPPSLPPPRQSKRHTNILTPIRARTDRYNNSPIPSMVRIINNK
ncbi:hypothetical protein Pcinc_005588 [Petrolisthes cinctipes]|uniref:Reverse transcriptase domain-containing protein n=1 Tax=Petrolisthes cinctipes TaxID=88211 RepID=A0AAE1GCD6_PETCI|nr:hypothetical protein Pcinc_005588 [Petrolisthes cinctipes]